MVWRELELAPGLAPDWLGPRPVFIPLASDEEACVVGSPEAMTLGFDIDRAIASLERETWSSEMRSLTHMLPFSYERLPWFIRGLGAATLFSPRRLTRHRKRPTWPIAPALDVLRFLRGDRLPELWSSGAWGACVTCDVDSLAGWRRALRVAESVEAQGFRATFFVVGEVLASEPAIATELCARGHEIGSHDIRHDNALARLRGEALRSRLARARDTIRPFEGVGFRSPSLMRSPEFLQAVGDFFDYDSSVCDTDLEYARGVMTVRPYLLDGACELPITLPMDSSLRFTLHSTRSIDAIWRQKCEWIRALGGLATLTIHSEPQLAGGRPFLKMVSAFLAWLRTQHELEHLLARELAERMRGASKGEVLSSLSAPACDA